jgi:hypothetical protein
MKMVNYQNGKIYKIECNETGQVYYGSTTRKLCDRVAQHRSQYRRWIEGKSSNVNSFIIIGRGNYSYSLVEDFPCERKEQLYAREGWYVKNNDCVNKYVPGRTYEEYREENKEKIANQRKTYRENNKEKIAEINKEYYDENKEKIAEKNKKYYEENKEKFAEKHKKYHEENREKILDFQKKWREENKEKRPEYDKKYYEENKEKIAEKSKKYREDNKDKISEKRKEKVKCECCNGEITRSSWCKHIKSKKHIENSK